MDTKTLSIFKINPIDSHPDVIKFSITTSINDEVSSVNEILIEPHVWFRSIGDDLYINWNTKLPSTTPATNITTLPQTATVTTPLPVPGHYYFLPDMGGRQHPALPEPKALIFKYDEVYINNVVYNSIDDLMIALSNLFHRHHPHQHSHFDLDAFYNYIHKELDKKADRYVRDYFVPEIDTTPDTTVEYHKQIGSYTIVDNRVFVDIQISATLVDHITENLSTLITITLPEIISPFTEDISPDDVPVQYPSMFFGIGCFFNLHMDLTSFYIPVVQNDREYISFVRSHNNDISFDKLNYGDLDDPSKIILSLSITYDL